jgi:uncharacterized protein (DUF2384 family)
MSNKTKTHVSPKISRGSSKPETAAGSSQKTSKTRSACEKVVRLCNILKRVKYAGCGTDVLLRERCELEEKVVPEAGTAPKRSVDLEALKESTAKHAAEVFGSAEIARRWLQEPNLAIDGRPPMELLDSESGYARVRTLLDRIDYGVLA